MLSLFSFTNQNPNLDKRGFIYNRIFPFKCVSVPDETTQPKKFGAVADGNAVSQCDKPQWSKDGLYGYRYPLWKYIGVGPTEIHRINIWVGKHDRAFAYLQFGLFRHDFSRCFS